MSRLLLSLLLLIAARASAQQRELPPELDDAQADHQTIREAGERAVNEAAEKARVKDAPDEGDKPAGKKREASKPAPSLAGTGPEVDEAPNLNLSDAKAAAPGSYKGVAPGAAALPPRAPKLPLKRGPQRMTWPGFQIKEGVPTVFLEVTSAPDYRVAETPGAVTVTLKNTIVPLRNNRRALDVTAFDSPVKQVETRSSGHDVRVTIKTKGGARPQHRERVEDAAGGFRMLVIELPK
jgi:hypothetical protein